MPVRRLQTACPLAPSRPEASQTVSRGHLQVGGWFHILHEGCCVLVPVSLHGVCTKLADQHKVMDTVSNAPRRNLLARHIHEMVDILEQNAGPNFAWSDVFSYREIFSFHHNGIRYFSMAVVL